MNPPAIGTENPSPVIHIPPVKWDPFQSPYINNHPPVVPLPGVPLVPPGLCTDVANGPFAATANGSISNSRKKSIYILGCGQFSTARPSSFSNQTVLVLQCDFQTLTAGTWITDSAGAFAEAYLLDEFGARLFQGTWTGTGTQRTITFAPPAATRFSGVEICLDAYSVFNVTNVTTAYDCGQGAFGSSHLTHHDTVWSVGADGGLHLHVDAGFQVDDPGGGYTTFLRTYTTITAPDILPYVPTNYDVFGNMTLFASDDDYFATYHAFQSWKTGVIDSVSPVGQWKNYLGQLVTVMNGPLDPATQSPAYRMRTAPRAGDLTINYPNPYEVWLFGSQLQITAMMWNPGAWLATWRYLLDYVIYGQANKRLIVNSGQFYNLCP